jgi:hypothetical protein
MSIKRDRERRYFEEFRTVYGLQGVPIYADKPDVILKSDRTIGIEITNFYIECGEDETSEQRQRPRRAKVIADAQDLHRSAGGRRTALTITFDPAHPITVARQRVLPRELADLAHRVDGHEMGQVSSLLFEASPEIERVWFNPQEYGGAKWMDAQVYAPEFLATDVLQEIIRQKEARVVEYSTCDAYWLLVVVEFLDPAQDQEITRGPLKLPFSVFERIFVYKTITKELIEITRV